MTARGLYRPRAIAQHADAPERRVAMLSPEPDWLRHSLLVLLLAATLIGVTLFVGRIGEYVVGPALVRRNDHVNATCSASGVVESVLVESGQTVRAGDPIARLGDATEVASFERAEKEFDMQLAKSLQDPADKVARATLAALRTERDLARARIDARTVRAPVAGVVTDISRPSRKTR